MSAARDSCHMCSNQLLPCCAAPPQNTLLLPPTAHADDYVFSSRQLDIDSQKLARFGQTKIPAKALCVYLTLRDAAITAPEDMPYIRCSMTVINHANRDNDIKQGACARRLHAHECPSTTANQRRAVTMQCSVLCRCLYINHMEPVHVINSPRCYKYPTQVNEICDMHIIQLPR